MLKVQQASRAIEREDGKRWWNNKHRQASNHADKLQALSSAWWLCRNVSTVQHFIIHQVEFFIFLKIATNGVQVD